MSTNNELTKMDPRNVGQWKTATTETLERDSAGGWALVASFVEDREVSLYDDIAEQSVRSIAARRVFVLFRDAESALAKVSAELAAKTSESSDRYWKLESATRELAKTKAALDAATANFATAQETIARDVASYRKIETDLGRVRESIGAQAFDRIVKGGAP